jgi:predicted acyl esterase
MQRVQRFSLAAVLLAVLIGLWGPGGLSPASAADAEVAKSKKKQGKKKAGKKKKAKKLKKAPKATSTAAFTARGSVGDAYVRDASPGVKLMLVNRKNRIVAEGKADSFGSKIFYDQKPGAGYRVLSRQDGQVAGTSKFRILNIDQNPPQSFYDAIELKEGLNYVKMRDGIELAMTVRLPGGKSMADGPFPTFIEHSGYPTAAPHGQLNQILAGDDPLAPAASTAVGSIVGPLLDFATVSVQMRGSGCSGGAFDLFGLPTTYDGYDMVEAVAAQPWVKGGKVGMGGISFSGISQLFAAGTQPPHLAAISPLSITDDLYTGTGYPGGIFNKGFALSWIQERMDEAQPAPGGGQEWAKVMTTTGDPDSGTPGPDQHCIDNQKMRYQTRNAVKLVEKNPYRTPKLFKYRAPGYWMSRIEVPTLFASQFQDEQTGGRFAESLKNLNGNPNVWMLLQNGPHVDSLGPSVITRWVEFMKLFVADEVPRVDPAVIELGPALYDAVAPGAGAKPLEQTRFVDYTNAEDAMRVFKQDPRVQLLMENGNGAPEVGPGAIGAKWQLNYGSWPIKQAKATPFYLSGKGALSKRKPKGNRKVTYKADPKARPAQTLGGTAGGVGSGNSEEWSAQPGYDWQPVKPGKGIGFTTPPLAKDAIVAGSSGLDLFMKSSKRDTDIQVTLTEVRPDGKETYVQNGWLRASHRKLNKKLSRLPNNPTPTHLKRDARPMPKGKFVKIRVPIYPVVHAFRVGSKIRVTVQAVGGDRPRWDFATVDKGKAKNTVWLGGKKASRLVIPILKGATTQGNPLPPPTALRGQPSRDYVPASNGG